MTDSKKMSRRNFLAGVAATAATAGLAGCNLAKEERTRDEFNADKEKIESDGYGPEGNDYRPEVVDQILQYHINKENSRPPL